MRAISFNILRRRSRIFAIEFAAAAVDQRSVYRRDPAYEARSRGLTAHGGEHEEARAGESRADLRAWVEWATEAADVRPQFIANRAGHDDGRVPVRGAWIAAAAAIPRSSPPSNAPAAVTIAARGPARGAATASRNPVNEPDLARGPQGRSARSRHPLGVGTRVKWTSRRLLAQVSPNFRVSLSVWRDGQRAEAATCGSA